MISASARASALAADGLAMWEGEEVDYVDAASYPDLQTAMSAVSPHGGRLLISGDMRVPSGGLIVDRPVEIFGLAPWGGGIQTGISILRPHQDDTPNQPILVIPKGNSYYPQLSDIVIRDLQLNGGCTAPRAGSYGIICDLDTAQKVQGLKIARVAVGLCGSDGMYLNGIDGANSCIIDLELVRNRFQNNWGRGGYVHGATIVNSRGNYFHNNQSIGLHYGGAVAAHAYKDYFENNCLSSSLDPVQNAQLLVSGGNCTLDGCDFENFATFNQPVCRRGIVFNNASGAIGSCKFINGAELNDSQSRGIYAELGSGGTVTVFSNIFQNCKTAIEVDAASVGVTVMQQTFGVGTNALINCCGMALQVIPAANLPNLGANTRQGGVIDDAGKLRFWDGVSWKTVNSF